MQQAIACWAVLVPTMHLKQVREMCGKVLWLHKGRQIAFGENWPICDRYEGFLDRNLSLKDIQGS